MSDSVFDQRDREHNRDRPHCRGIELFPEEVDQIEQQYGGQLVLDHESYYIITLDYALQYLKRYYRNPKYVPYDGVEIQEDPFHRYFPIPVNLEGLPVAFNTRSKPVGLMGWIRRKKIVRIEIARRYQV